MRDWNNRRENFGVSNFDDEMGPVHIESYRNHLRILPEEFDELFVKIGSEIEKKSLICEMRKLIIKIKTR